MATVVNYRGDIEQCPAFRIPALNQLQILLTQLSYKNLKQGNRVFRYDTGVVITCTTHYGDSFVDIYVPEDIAVPVEKEEVVETVESLPYLILVEAKGKEYLYELKVTPESERVDIRPKTPSHISLFGMRSGWKFVTFMVGKHTVDWYGTFLRVDGVWQEDIEVFHIESLIAMRSMHDASPGYKYTYRLAELFHSTRSIIYSETATQFQCSNREYYFSVYGPAYGLTIDYRIDGMPIDMYRFYFGGCVGQYSQHYISSTGTLVIVTMTGIYGYVNWVGSFPFYLMCEYSITDGKATEIQCALLIFPMGTRSWMYLPY